MNIAVISELEKNYNEDVESGLINYLLEETKEEVWKIVFETLKRNLKNSDTPEQNTWYKIAEKLLKEKKIQFALLCFDRILELNPYKETIGSIGAVLNDHGLYENALGYFEMVIEIDPNDARGWGGKGLALSNIIQQEEEQEKVIELIEESISCCKIALKIDPKLKVTRDTLATIYYKRGNYEAMALLVQETLQFDPGDIKARVMLSEALALSTKLIEAESEAQKALEIVYKKEYAEPVELSIIHQQLGIIYAMRGYRERAIAEFKEAIRANSREVWSYKLLSAYILLNTLGTEMKGSPLERRSRLFKLAEMRSEEVAYSDALELGI